MPAKIWYLDIILLERRCAIDEIDLHTMYAYV